MFAHSPTYLEGVNGDGRKKELPRRERERERNEQIKVKEDPVRCEARRTLKGYTDTNALRGGFVCVCVCVCACNLQNVRFM